MNETPQTLEHLSPVEIDTVLARVWYAEADTANSIARNSHYLDQAIKAVEAGKVWEQSNIERYGDLLASLRVQALNLRNEARPHEAEYVRRGMWSRYFLVTSSDGHVHRGMNCQTCFASTEYGWLPELSGCDEAAMIVEFGEKACTVCFPDAPANPAFHAPGRRDRASVEARAAERAERDAVKASKAITDVDGSVLRDDHGGKLQTKVAARNALSSMVEAACWYGSRPERDASIRRVAAALDAAGLDSATIISRKAAKCRKEGAEHGVAA